MFKIGTGPIGCVHALEFDDFIDSTRRKLNMIIIWY